MAQKFRVFLPVPPIKILFHYPHPFWKIDTPEVDTETIRIGSWNIKGLDATVHTEQMSGSSGIEAIFVKGIMAVEQLESICWNDQVHKSCHPAYGAVAMLNSDFLSDQDFKRNAPAMAAASHMHQIHVRH